MIKQFARYGLEDAFAPALKRRHLLSAGFVIFSLFYVYENFSAQVPRQAYAVFAAYYMLLISAEIKHIDLRRVSYGARALGIWIPLGIIIVGLLIALSAFDRTYARYVLGDMYVVGQFALVMAVFSISKSNDEMKTAFKTYMASIALMNAAFVYLTYTRYFAGIGRYAGPDILLVILSAWYAFYRKSVFALLVLASLLYMSAMSGFRYGFAICALMTLIVVACSRKNLKSLKTVIMFVIFSTIILYTAFVDADRFKSIRLFSDTLAGEQAALTSVYSHLYEAGNALHEMWSNGPWALAFGGGHGALYEGYVSFDLEENLTEKGTHNIHMSPVMLMFRYGLLGIGWYILLAAWSLKKTASIYKRAGKGVIDDFGAISAIYLTALLAGSLMSNNFTNIHLPAALCFTACLNQG